MIDQLIQQIASKVGIDESIARRAVGVVMGFLNKEGDPSAVGSLFEKIPGAAELASQYEPGASGGLGGLMGKMGGMLGGNKMGDAMAAMAAFKETGLSMDQAQDMMPVVKDFISENAGPDVMAKAINSVPALKDLLK
ncbi:MAG: DUF2780 domain-containing protein [Aquisalinus sp.]|nr:DUF2780 domain-containing protein [Aquisalinus sp.]